MRFGSVARVRKRDRLVRRGGIQDTGGSVREECRVVPGRWRSGCGARLAAEEACRCQPVELEQLAHAAIAVTRDATSLAHRNLPR
jgi:hypothetical protein